MIYWQYLTESRAQTSHIVHCACAGALSCQSEASEYQSVRVLCLSQRNTTPTRSGVMMVMTFHADESPKVNPRWNQVVSNHGNKPHKLFCHFARTVRYCSMGIHWSLTNTIKTPACAWMHPAKVVPPLPSRFLQQYLPPSLPLATPSQLQASCPTACFAHSLAL